MTRVPPLSVPSHRWPGTAALLAIVALALAVRAIAAHLLQQPLESDGLSYFTMAKNLAEQGTLIDNNGQRAFYSAGYPLLLAPFFLLCGATVPVALALNLALAAASVWLVWRMAILLSGHCRAGLIAAFAYALWMPAIWNATLLAKENLTTPLLLAFTLCVLHLGRGAAPVRHALGAGLLWGASLLAGGSAILLCAGCGVALLLLWRGCGRLAPSCAAGLAFAGGALLVLTPWLYATQQMVGRPVLTTNAAFNLYLGNNPAATGYFVSISDTPVGARGWNRMLAVRGETGTADVLKAQALDWIADQPMRAAELAMRKLVYFWLPNIPDTADFRASTLLSLVRLVEVAQYLLILAAGVTAFRSRSIARADAWIVAAVIAGFWLVHGATYIIPRYRDPIIPLLIVMASIAVAQWLPRPGGGGGWRVRHGF